MLTHGLTRGVWSQIKIIVIEHKHEQKCIPVLEPNTQVPSSDIITSLCGYSSVNEAWKVCVYVNGGASAMGDV